MNCESFDRWLDEGLPAGTAAPARNHAARCARCAAELSTALELETALAESVERAAPAGFTAGVLARIAPGPRVSPVRVWVLPPLEWWLRAAADPPAALGVALAALVLACREPLWSAASSAGAWIAGLSGALAGTSVLAPGMDFALPHLAGRFAAPAATLSFVPPLLIGSWWLYRWAERAMARAAGRGPRSA